MPVPVKTGCGCAYLSLQKPLVPELTIMINLVVILDGINVDKIEAFAQTGRIGYNFGVRRNPVDVSNNPLSALLI